jgi:transcriptional regulator with XRE-family HTH domain
VANDELRQFLRSRRGRVEPADVGLPEDAGPRRVPGLRREELARLAGVSVDYYVRLEQGRATNASEDVLDAVARALRLDDDERTHLFDLARPARPRHRPRAPQPQRVRPGIRVLLDGLETPAFLLGRRLDVLATNRMARALLCDFDARPPRERNHARWVFLDPAARELYVDWEAIARDNVAALRMDAGRHPDDPELSALVGELSVKSPEFAGWWAERDVARLNHGTKRYHHPIVGDLTVGYEALPLPDDPEQRLFLYSVQPGSASEDALRLLASWTLETAGRDDG